MDDSFFVEQYGIDLNKSAYFVLFIPIIGFVGRMLYPLFYKLCREKEHTVSTYAFLLCVFATIPLLLKATPPMLSAICLGLLYAAVWLFHKRLRVSFGVYSICTFSCNITAYYNKE